MLSDERRQRIIDLARAGHTHSAIAREVGCCRDTVQDALRNAGLLQPRQLGRARCDALAATPEWQEMLLELAGDISDAIRRGLRPNTAVELALPGEQP